MTPLERLALQVSARISGADLVLVLDYAEALKRETRLEALREALSTLGSGAFSAEAALREMIERETANGH